MFHCNFAKIFRTMVIWFVAHHKIRYVVLHFGQISAFIEVAENIFTGVYIKSRIVFLDEFKTDFVGYGPVGVVKNRCNAKGFNIG